MPRRPTAAGKSVHLVVAQIAQIGRNLACLSTATDTVGRLAVGRAGRIASLVAAAGTAAAAVARQLNRRRYGSGGGATSVTRSGRGG